MIVKIMDHFSLMKIRKKRKNFLRQLPSEIRVKGKGKMVKRERERDIGEGVGSRGRRKRTVERMQIVLKKSHPCP